ncbi:hypothetical protein, partial [Acinetobacter baumannii]|uniref:hypothetical protein n=1 Tax=Acinetobacter baumannii TaxID=470 RepID=UPI001BB466B5
VITDPLKARLRKASCGLRISKRGVETCSNERGDERERNPPCGRLDSLAGSRQTFKIGRGTA